VHTWYQTASRNIHAGRNRVAKLRSASAFGDDEPNMATFINDPENAAIAAASRVSAALANSPTTEGAPEGVGTIVHAGIGLAAAAAGPVGVVPTVVIETAAQIVSAAGSSGDALKTGAALAQQGASGPALAAAAAAHTAAAVAAFNTGVAIVNGATKTLLIEGMSSAGTAGYLAAHGMKGAPPAVKEAIAGVLLNSPAAKAGLAAGFVVTGKSWWHKLLHFLHLEA
jgi:hypothetical protein